MPTAETVRPIPLDDLHSLLARAGLTVRRGSWSASHREGAAAPTDASRIGRRALEELLTGHRLWNEWLAAGRVRKFGPVAERPAG